MFFVVSKKNKKANGDTITPSHHKCLNTSDSHAFLILLGLDPPLEPTSLLSCHGNSTLRFWKDPGVMFLLRASTSISFIILLLHFFSFLLTKLFTYLCLQAASKRDVGLNSLRDEPENAAAQVTRECSEKERLITDVIHGRQRLLVPYKKSYNNGSLLVEQGRDSNEMSCFKVENNFVPESTYVSPLEDLPEEKHVVGESDIRTKGLLTRPDFQSPTVLTSDNAKETEVKDFQNNEEKNLSKDKSFLAINHTHSESKRFQLHKVHGDEANYGESLTGESTSKSSIEWRSSTIFRDLETDYPFSSSSRRSSSKRESYALFRKYDEEMLFFDRISARKLNETESLRSIKFHPRSISERIAHKFTTKNKKYSRNGRDPYQELESAYVAQICLTWEALNWNYYSFQRATSNKNAEDCGCPAQIAEQFQQFQVLLQRFIENESYEHGRRPEVYARMRISSPKLLQVPEFRDCEGDESKEDTSSKISSWKFLMILEDAIQTFMNFLRGDKKRYCRIFRALIKKKQNLVDPNYLRLVKKANRKKKLKLKELRKRRKYLRKKNLKEEDEMETLMGLIDMELVSRVLRMPEISEEQLHWCQEKMNKVKIWDGKLQRESSPLFFPVH